MNLYLYCQHSRFQSVLVFPRWLRIQVCSYEPSLSLFSRQFLCQSFGASLYLYYCVTSSGQGLLFRSRRVRRGIDISASTLRSDCLEHCQCSGLRRGISYCARRLRGLFPVVFRPARHHSVEYCMNSITKMVNQWLSDGNRGGIGY